MLIFFLWISAFAQIAKASELNLPSKSIYEPDWQWTNDEGKSIKLAEYKNSLLILTLTYTSCKMSCPTTMRILKKVDEDLRKKNFHTNFVIISFDTENDTVKRLANYKKQWELPKNWHFLTGTAKVINEIEKFLNFKVSYDKIDDHYSHDKKIYMIDAEGKIKKYFEDWDSDFTDIRDALVNH